MMLPFVVAPSKAASSGFVFDEHGVTNSANPSEFIKLGEQLSQAALKRRFTGYQIDSREGDDCSICASVKGQAGELFVVWDNKGTHIESVGSLDKTSTDSLGYRIGDSLAAAIGAKSAICDGGIDGNGVFRCASSRVTGLAYNSEPRGCKEGEMPLGGGSGNGRLLIIPDCAKVDGFDVSLKPPIEKLPWGLELEKVLTVTSRSGIDTDHAVITGVITPDDANTYCEAQNDGKVTKSCLATVKDNARSLKPEVSAKCSAKEFTDFAGNRYAFLGANPDKAKDDDGQLVPYLVKDLGTGGIVDRSKDRLYYAVMELFSALCPANTPKDW